MQFNQRRSTKFSRFHVEPFYPFPKMYRESNYKYPSGNSDNKHNTGAAMVFLSHKRSRPLSKRMLVHRIPCFILAPYMSKCSSCFLSLGKLNLCCGHWTGSMEVTQHL